MSALPLFAAPLPALPMTAPVNTPLHITLNGQPQRTAATSLQALLHHHGYAPDGAYACAVNQSFVPRSQWAQHTVQEGDRIEVVSPVTGG